MAGLVGYASSDEEDEGLQLNAGEATEAQVSSGRLGQATTEARQEDDTSPAERLTKSADATSTRNSEPAQVSQPDALAASQPLLGPAVGPSAEDAAAPGPALPPLEEPLADDAADGESPPSPYSANRALLHDLTLPSVPNLDIPPSPPGSPPPGANKKFQQFLALKKKGTHFNSKLEQSTALRNPSLTDKLMAFVELDGPSQYETTLPTDLWDPGAFPDWAYRENLRKTRETVAKAREADRAAGGPRSAVDFVSSSSSTPGKVPAPGLSRGEKRKGGWN